MFMYKTVICVVYVDDCLFWARSQSEIDNVINSFNEDGPIYNWEHSKGDSVYEFLCIDFKTLDYGVSKFLKTVFIRKLLEATGVDRCNGLSTPTKVEAPLGTDENSSEDKSDFLNSYTYVIGIMLYMASKTRPCLYFAVH